MAKGKYQEWLTEEGLLKLAAWARDGLTYEDIAHNVGINVATLATWRTKYSAIDKALMCGREVADIRVENALYKRAMGYDYDEVTYERKINKLTGEDEMIPTKSIRRHVLPDVTAQIFWLKNRRVDVWRDKREVQADISDDRETGVVMLAPVLEEAATDDKKTD